MAKRVAKKTPKQKIKTSEIELQKRTKRNTKDSVFTHLFSIPEYQLKMYQALHPEDQTVISHSAESSTNYARNTVIRKKRFAKRFTSVAIKTYSLNMS